MLDLHVHVLPGIDDGPRTMEDALALARALAEDGIEHIVATPHIYPGVFDNSATRIGEAFDEFQVAVSDAGIDLTMTWAAEVRICPEVLDWIELRRLPMLNGSLVGPSTALIELPDGQIPVGTDKLMGMMLDLGITPLMAHPERNKAVMEQSTRLEALRRLGCKFQVTAGSLLGDFGSRAQTTAQKLLDAGWVDVIATDSHNRSSRRPRMGAARDWLTKHFDEALALRLTKTHPTEIAGLTSFTVQAGAQRLVFRDLPATSPLEKSDPWSVDQLLGADPPERQAESTTQTEHTKAAAWSLIDFRLDTVADELENAARLNDPDPGQEVPLPSASEDWQLPVFGRDAGVEAPRATTKAPESAPAPTIAFKPAQSTVPVPTPAPAVKPESNVALLETASMSMGQQSQPASPLPAATLPAAPPQPSRGLRLTEVSPRQTASIAPRPVEDAPPRPAAARAGPMAQAGNQAPSLAAIARSISVAARHEATEPSPRPASPEGAPQGFRLRDLTPLPTRRR